MDVDKNGWSGKFTDENKEVQQQVYQSLDSIPNALVMY